MLKKRLIISTGYFSTMTAVAKLMEENSCNDYLVIASAIENDAFKKSNILLAETIWDFEKIFFSKNLNLQEFDNNFDEIYAPYFLEEIQSLVFNNKNAKIIWYDEGLGSYNPVPRDNRYKFYEERIKEVSLLEYNDLFKCFLFPKAKHSKIKKSNFLSVINKVKNIIKKDFSEYKSDNNILFLAQNFHDYNMLSREETIKLNVNKIKLLLDKGYPVIYKEHFRTKDRIFKDIKNIIKNENLKEIDLLYPVELFAQELNLKAIVSLASSASLTLPYLFKIPAFCFGSETFIKNIQPKNTVGCFSAFTHKIYNPDIDLIKDKENLWQIYETYQKNLPISLEHPLLVFKYISSFKILATKKQYILCQNLLLEDLSSEIFTPKNKEFLNYIKKQNYNNYFIKEILKNIFCIIKIEKDIKRLIRTPHYYSLQVLIIKILKGVKNG